MSRVFTPYANLARAGVAPQIAQRVMRHSDYRTTLRHYTVLGLTDMVGAVAALPSIGAPHAGTAAATGTHANPQQYHQQCAQQYGRETVRTGAAERDERRGVSTAGGDRNPLSAAKKSERTQPGAAACEKAGEEIRTPDVQLGKLAFYH